MIGPVTSTAKSLAWCHHQVQVSKPELACGTPPSRGPGRADSVLHLQPGRAGTGGGGRRAAAVIADELESDSDMDSLPWTPESESKSAIWFKFYRATTRPGWDSRSCCLDHFSGHAWIGPPTMTLEQRPGGARLASSTTGTIN
jgi:hypothetical protein